LTADRPSARALRDALRARIREDRVLIVPGVSNVFEALLAQRAGVEVLFVTGAGIANALYGYPDIGLVTLTEIADVNRRIARSISVPIIADLDTGFGNHLNAMRAIDELEAARVAGVIIEDQQFPKRCGHFRDKSVVPPSDMVTKLCAVNRARDGSGLVLAARTDAIAVEGIDAAIERARMYVDAGVDLIFVEAPTTIEELARIPQSVSVPCIVNIVDGGVTPTLSASELAAMGYRVVLYANVALRTQGWMAERTFRHLLVSGSAEQLAKQMLTWDDRQMLVGLPEWDRLDADLAADALAVIEGGRTREHQL
jgi:2-methylisocitrate lyase-like PEP mutase family enzyme